MLFGYFNSAQFAAGRKKKNKKNKIAFIFLKKNEKKNEGRWEGEGRGGRNGKLRFSCNYLYKKLSKAILKPQIILIFQFQFSLLLRI